MKKLFVPDEFVVPVIYKTKDFTIRKLTPLDTEQDFKAVMEAKDHIHELYPYEYTEGWPDNNLTVKEDEEDLKRHEKEFDAREAFAYTVFDAENKRCLGCIYIDPSEEYDAEVTMWTRNETEDRLLFNTVRKWLESSWPFKKVDYPVLEEKYK